MRQVSSVLLILLLAAPPTELGSASASGVIQGSVRVGDSGVSGIQLALIEVDTGVVVRARSGASGSFSASVTPGRYALTTEGATGLVVDDAPALMTVTDGEVATARVALVALPSALVQEADPATSLTIRHEAVDCFVEGEYPLLEAAIEPASSVVRARVYFRSARGTEFFYVEMTPEAGGFTGKLPRPGLDASPVVYYLWAAGTDFGEGRTEEHSAIVVESADECEGRLAAIGPPGDVTVFSAVTGAVITPVGFAAGGIALTAGTIAVLIGGAAAAGISAAVTVFNPKPSPTPTPIPSPTPTPTPEPTPRPTPTPTPTPEPTPEPPPPLTSFK